VVAVAGLLLLLVV
jgi:hypothetical protein